MADLRRARVFLIAGSLVLEACSAEKPAPPVACQAITGSGNVTVGSGAKGDPAAPSEPTRYRDGGKLVTARSYMVVTDNPLASKAGCDVLEAGGTAVDAAVAVQMVLGLVEPQASGLGGGAFLLYYDAATRDVQAYDGRETAPAAATENYLRFVDDARDQTPPVPSARASGRAIGTPGALRMLDLAHHDHGRLAWNDLFTPAIDLANHGFAVGGLLAFAIDTEAANLTASKDAAALYLDVNQAPKGLAAFVRNTAYADTLTAIAAGGADVLYTGELAQAIVDEIQAPRSATGDPITPGVTTLADLAGYQARRRDAVCARYRAYWVCGVPPPSSGGITVASTLGVLESFDLGAYKPQPVDGNGGVPQVAGVHLVAEAERLAYADRDKYVADADFVPLPGGSPDALLDKAYLQTRAGLIRMDASIGTAEAGDFGAPVLGIAATPEHGTSHMTIVDADGNALVMTTTVESFFGSYHMTHGFVLNNQLTDFSPVPTDEAGQPIANRVAAGKRPRSSMAPTLVFTAAPDGSRGDFLLGTGSPGGATIIQYVVKTVVGVLDWGLDAQQATAMVDFGAANSPSTNVGSEHPDVRLPDDPLVRGLRALGHDVNTSALSSGIGTVVRVPTATGSVLTGGADPRREGIVLGDAFRP